MIETRWQNHWHKTNLFKVKEDRPKEKYYLLEMFPYPPVLPGVLVFLFIAILLGYIPLREIFAKKE